MGDAGCIVVVRVHTAAVVVANRLVCGTQNVAVRIFYSVAQTTNLVAAVPSVSGSFKPSP